MPEAFVNSKRYRLEPNMAIGKGGEADVYDIGSGEVLKLFHSPSHPDLVSQPAAQKMAKRRLAEHQKKLRVFPASMPPRVVTPTNLATDQKGDIVGYTMPRVKQAEVLYRYGERSWRDGRVSSNELVKIFRDLHTTVAGIHARGVVIGDFNDLNILVRDNEAYIIDADSFQYGGFMCVMYTNKFLDPLLCDPRVSAVQMVAPHNPSSDWYAYAVMLMNCLLYVHPYGGVYKPKSGSPKVTHDARPLHRITVFHPEVRYPKPAIPYETLPDALLDQFESMFIRDVREVFPAQLFDNLRWTTCTLCGTEHARGVCPACKKLGLVKETIRIRGTVKASRIFNTSGRILAFAMFGSKLAYLYHESGTLVREDGTVIATTPLNLAARYRVSRNKTVIALNHQAVVAEHNGKAHQISVDQIGSLPIIDANAERLFWAHGGALWRQGQWDNEQIGQVLSHNTLFWVGDDFGFGFYRAGELTQAFVFSTKAKGINDSVKIPRLPGQVIDATATFSHQYCWFFVSGQTGTKTINMVVVLDKSGNVLGSDQAEAGSDSWLGTIRGHAAAAGFLLAATDDGIARIELTNGSLQVTRQFVDTEEFVNSGSQLVVGNDGVYVVSAKEIWRLQISDTQTEKGTP